MVNIYVGLLQEPKLGH